MAISGTNSLEVPTTYAVYVRAKGILEFPMIIKVPAFAQKFHRGKDGPFLYGVPSGYLTVRHGKIHHSIGKPSISMVIFNSYVSHYQRVSLLFPGVIHFSHWGNIHPKG